MGISLEYFQNSQISEENFVASIFEDPHFKLKNYTYLKLLNKLLDNRIKQKLHKKYVEENVIPDFYDDKPSNKYRKFHKELFNYILSQLNEVNNIYEVFLYFYPFINHEEEQCENNIYSMLNFICGKLDLKNFLRLTEKYSKYLTFDLNELVYKNTDDIYLRNTLLCVNYQIYNKENISKFIAIKFFDLVKVYGENDVIPNDVFNKSITKIGFESFKNFRETFRREYCAENDY